MLSIETVLTNIKSGLDRDTDEAGAGGFWDVAGQLSDIHQEDGRPALTQDEQDILQVGIYEALWTLYEAKTA